MKYLFLFLVILAACQSQSNRENNTRSNRSAAPNTVTHVIDGDTFTMTDTTGRHEIKVRLIGVDAPETRNNPHGPRGAYAQQAKAWLRNTIQGKTVRLDYDVLKTDRYGRTLAYVFLPDGRFINAEILKAGYAVTYTVPPNIKYDDTFYRLQQQARAAGVGLWGLP